MSPRRALAGLTGLLDIHLFAGGRNALSRLGIPLAALPPVVRQAATWDRSASRDRRPAAGLPPSLPRHGRLSRPIRGGNRCGNCPARLAFGNHRNRPGHGPLSPSSSRRPPRRASFKGPAFAEGLLPDGLWRGLGELSGVVPRATSRSADFAWLADQAARGRPHAAGCGCETMAPCPRPGKGPFAGVRGSGPCHTPGQSVRCIMEAWPSPRRASCGPLSRPCRPRSVRRRRARGAIFGCRSRPTRLGAPFGQRDCPEPTCLAGRILAEAALSGSDVPDDCRRRCRPEPHVLPLSPAEDRAVRTSPPRSRWCQRPSIADDPNP